MKGASLARAAVVVGIIAAGTSAGACTRQEPRAPTPGTKPDTAVELFRQTCLDCHDGTNTSRPNFSKKALDPAMASDAFGMVLQRTMPPSDGNKLDDAHRQIIANWLCLQTQRSQVVCDETVRNEFAPDAKRSSTALMAMLQRMSGGTISEDSTYQLQDASGDLSNEQHLRWTAVILLVVMDVCRPADPAAKPTAEAQEKMRSCLATHLRAALQPPKKPRAAP